MRGDARNISARIFAQHFSPNTRARRHDSMESAVPLLELARAAELECVRRETDEDIVAIYLFMRADDRARGPCSLARPAVFPPRGRPRGGGLGRACGRRQLGSRTDIRVPRSLVAVETNRRLCRGRMRQPPALPALQDCHDEGRVREVPAPLKTLELPHVRPRQQMWLHSLRRTVGRAHPVRRSVDTGAREALALLLLFDAVAAVPHIPAITSN